jgi:hypothetical protein
VPLSIDRASQRERAVVAAVRLLPKETQRDLRDASRQRIVPMAIKAASAHAETATMREILSRGRYSEFRGTPGVAFGGARPVTSSGVPGRVLVRGLEYGAAGRKESIYRRRVPSGGTVLTARHTTRQFMPDRSSNPTAVYPAVQAITDDVLQVWIELVEGAVLSAFGEG